MDYSSALVFPRLRSLPKFILVVVITGRAAEAGIRVGRYSDRCGDRWWDENVLTSAEFERSGREIV